MISELYTKQVVINTKIDKKLVKYIFSIVKHFLKQTEWQLTSAIYNWFVSLFINYPLKVNLLINPLPRNGRFGWYNTFKRHVTMSASSTNAKLELIGYSIIENFDKCKDIFNKFFLSFRTLNFSISGDKIKNILWPVCNMTLPSSAGYVIIHCGTNNIGRNCPL